MNRIKRDELSSENIRVIKTLENLQADFGTDSLNLIKYLDSLTVNAGVNPVLVDGCIDLMNFFNGFEPKLTYKKYKTSEVFKTMKELEVSSTVYLIMKCLYCINFYVEDEPVKFEEPNFGLPNVIEEILRNSMNHQSNLGNKVAIEIGSTVTTKVLNGDWKVENIDHDGVCLLIQNDVRIKIDISVLELVEEPKEIRQDLRAEHSNLNKELNVLKEKYDTVYESYLSELNALSKDISIKQSKIKTLEVRMRIS